MSFDRPLRFRLDADKALEALVYLANQAPGIDFYHVAKVLYFAEKRHLNEYGRPILGDAYSAMEHGPVPLYVYELLKRDPMLPVYALEATGKSIEVDTGDVPCIRPLRPVNLDLFSGTDIRCLQDALDTYGRMTWRELWDLSHREEAWQRADRNAEMSYEYMIDPKNRDLLMPELLELSAGVVL